MGGYKLCSWNEPEPAASETDTMTAYICCLCETDSFVASSSYYECKQMNQTQCFVFYTCIWPTVLYFTLHLKSYFNSTLYIYLHFMVWLQYVH